MPSYCPCDSLDLFKQVTVDLTQENKKEESSKDEEQTLSNTEEQPCHVR